MSDNERFQAEIEKTLDDAADAKVRAVLGDGVVSYTGMLELCLRLARSVKADEPVDLHGGPYTRLPDYVLRDLEDLVDEARTVTGAKPPNLIEEAKGNE